MTHDSLDCNVIQRTGRYPGTGVDVNKLREALASEPDAASITRETAREVAIRYMMEETGESRELVEGMVDALECMAEETVLEATQGEPTTLRDALNRYLDVQETILARYAESGPDGRPPQDGMDVREEVAQALHAFLVHPFPDRVPPADNVTHVLVTVRWARSDYYTRLEHMDLIRGWIESAFEDRSDSPTVEVQQLRDR